MPKLFKLDAQFNANEPEFSKIKDAVAAIGFADSFNGASNVMIYYSANNVTGKEAPTRVMGVEFPAPVPERKLQLNVGEGWILVEEKGSVVELSGFNEGFIPSRHYLDDGTIEDGEGKKAGHDNDQTRNRTLEVLNSIPQWMIASL